jgi:hypothetical protein
VDPRDAYKWSNGKAVSEEHCYLVVLQVGTVLTPCVTDRHQLLATGSPFPPAKLDESSEQYEIAECNNACVDIPAPEAAALR